MEPERDAAIGVLVVDDEQDIRDGSERILSRAGYEVYKASRGEEALDILSRTPLSIVLLDLKMPGMDGLEVLPKIKEMDESIQVIVITGYATVETAIEAMKRGAYDFIPKPFEPDQLRIVVNRAAEKVRLQREAQRLTDERRRTLADLATEQSRVRTILESLPDGVLVTNSKARVALMNRSARRMLAPDADDEAVGGQIGDYIPDAELCTLITEVSKGRHVDFDDIPNRELALSDSHFLLAKVKPVIGERNECLGAVINFADISEIKLLDRLKSEFVAKVSHELRSPLSTIHEQLALVIRDMVGGPSENDQHILARAKEKTQGLISLIGDLLDLSRIEEGLICRDPKPVQVEEILRSTADFLRTKAETKGQTLELSLPEAPLPQILADPIALESIFGNLIANAINYTPDNGRIQAMIDQAGVNLRVRVKDNGFGIPEQDLEKIFERFYRVKNENTRYITGTGLGLPIVKGLVDSMGGIIEVESEPGKGTVFTVLIPARNESD